MADSGKDVQISSLSLKIKSESNAAIKGLDKLRETLNKLKSVSTGKNLGLSGLKELSSSLARLKSVTSGMKLSSVASGINKIGEAVASLNPNSGGLSNLIESLQKLSDVSKSLPAIGAGLRDIKSGIRQSKAPKMTDVDNKTVTIGDVGAMGDVKGKIGEIPGLAMDYKEELKDTAEVANRSFSEIAEKFLNATSHIELLEMKLGGLKEKLGSVLEGGVTPDSASKIYSLVGAIGKLEGEIETLKNKAESAANVGRSTIESLMPSFMRLVSRLGLTENGITRALGVLRGAVRVSESVKRGISGMSSAFSKLGKIAPATGRMVKNALKIPFSPIINGFNNLKNSISGAIDKIQRFMGSLARIAMYRFVRAILSQISKGFEEGTANAYQFSKASGGALASSLDRVATSMLYLRNSIGAAVAPLINALAPAIDFVVSKFVGLINFINQAFASISGQRTWLKAKQYSTEYAKSAEKASGASVKAGKAATKSAKQVADAVKKATLGIDELNIIEKKRKDNSPEGSGALGGGAGASSSGPNFSQMFEEVPVENKIMDFVNNIKSYFERGDWEGLGRDLGNRLNSMIDSIDFKDFGHKIGSVIDASVKTALSFLRTVNFKKIGEKIADLFNGTMEKINFIDVGALIGRTMLLIPDTVMGFLKRLDWGLCARSLSDAIIGLFDELTNWIDSIDWDSATDELTKKIEDFITNVKWVEISKSLGRFLWACLRLGWAIFITTPGKLVEDAGGALFKKIFGDDVEVPEFVKNMFEHIGEELAGGIIGGIVGFFIGGPVGAAWGAAIGAALTDLINVIKSFFGIQSPSKKMASEVGVPIAEGLLKGIQDGMKSVAVGVLQASKSVIGWFTGGDGNGNIFDKFKSFGGSITSNLEKGIRTTYSNVKGTLTSWAGSIKSWFTGGGKDNIFNKFKSFGENITSRLREGISKTCNNVKNTVTNWASNIVGWFKGSGENSIFGKFVNVGKSIVSGLGQGIQNAYEGAKNVLKGWGENIVNWFTGGSGKNNIKNRFETLGGDSAVGYLEGMRKKMGDSRFFSRLAMYGPKGFEKGLVIGSPSKVFMKIGEWSAEGYNIGIENGMKETAEVIEKWVNLVSHNAQKLVLNPDPSSLKYDINDYEGSVSTEINGKTRISISGLKEGIESFYKEQLLPIITEIAEDMRRQADKEEKTVVQIGGRTIEQAVTTQRSANGYNFLG